MAPRSGVRADLAEREQTDAALLGIVRSGERSAYGELWRRHVDPARAYARATTGYDADDLVSEAFVRVLKAALDGRGPQSSFRPYLFRTIRNLSIDRSRGREELTNSDLEAIADPRNPESETLWRAELANVSSAFSQLPARWRHILWLTEVESMRPREVASLVGMAPGSVSQLAFRARNALRGNWRKVTGGTAGRDDSSASRAVVEPTAPRR